MCCEGRRATCVEGPVYRGRGRGTHGRCEGWHGGLEAVAVEVAVALHVELAATRQALLKAVEELTVAALSVSHACAVHS